MLLSNCRVYRYVYYVFCFYDIYFEFHRDHPNNILLLGKMKEIVHKHMTLFVDLNLYI